MINISSKADKFIEIISPETWKKFNDPETLADDIFEETLTTKTKLATAIYKDYADFSKAELKKEILNKISGKKKAFFYKQSITRQETILNLSYHRTSIIENTAADRDFSNMFLQCRTTSGTATYMISESNAVTNLNARERSELLAEFLQPENNSRIVSVWRKQKNNLLDYLKANTNIIGFDHVMANADGKPAYDVNYYIDEHMTNISDCIASFILEHIFDGNISILCECVPDKIEDNKIITFKITDIVDIMPYMSNDEFIDQCSKHIHWCYNKFSIKQVTHPLPYSNNSTELSFVHFDVENFIADVPCPKWDLALSERLSCQEEVELFRAAVWQVYDSNNRSRQLIYLYDPHGHSGKSAILRAAFKPLDNCTIGLSKQSLNNNFGFAKVWNQQLVQIGDNKNPLLLKSQIIHTMTGGDACDVEYKGRNSFSAAFKGHVWCNGNVKLDIDVDAEHEISRVVLFNINKPKSAFNVLYQLDEDGNIKLGENGQPLIGTGDCNFEVELYNELSGFLYKCRKDYAKWCPNGTDLRLPQFMQDRIYNECAGESNQIFNSFIEDYIILNDNKDDYISDKNLREVWKIWYSQEKDNYADTVSFKELIEHLGKLKYTATKSRDDKIGYHNKVWRKMKFKFDPSLTNLTSVVDGENREIDKNDINDFI